MLDQTIFNQDNQIQSFDNAGNLIINGVFDLGQNRVVINEFNICEDDNINNIKQFINVCKSKRIDQISFNVPNNAHEPDEQQEITDLLNESGFTVSENQGVIVGSINL
jgi:precorrin-3B methylase